MTDKSSNIQEATIVIEDDGYLMETSQTPNTKKRVREEEPIGQAESSNASPPATKKAKSNESNVIVLKGTNGSPVQLNLTLHCSGRQQHPIRIQLEDSVVSNLSFDTKTTVSGSVLGDGFIGRIGRGISIGAQTVLGVGINYGTNVNEFIGSGGSYSMTSSNANNPSVQFTINGNVGGRVNTTTGNVICKGDIKSDVSTMSGDVTCESTIGGNAKTMSGDIDCKGTIRGSASSMSGDIKYKR